VIYTSRYGEDRVWKLYGEYRDNVAGVQHAKETSAKDKRDDYRMVHEREKVI
jgi:hypothetical protein